MNGAFNLNLLGRFGNTLFQVAFALAYCKRHDLDLRIEGPWIGEGIFNLKLGRFKERFHDRKRNEDTLDPEGEADVEFTGYCQNQKSLIYTRSEVRGWFNVPGVPERHNVCMHYRSGDFKGYNYPVVSKSAHLKAVSRFGFPKTDNVIISEEHGNDLIEDWLQLVHCRYLSRANSSYSFWASVLGGHEMTIAPIIKGLEGGMEHDDVQFCAGNHPRLSMHDFCTDLHLKP